ncbi:YsaB family lipoprotein [Enterobacter cloacae complex sp. 2024EL-00215]|uniref:YsaB family lipoprotein n=1 Tax=Enterobacter TaxID=547 RepID=UPI0015DC674F|nr:YsaB family lipoprotein [Enterobacter sp. RHBSTW-00901]MBA7855876.1 hypothetical protein [Enterobacter sp. RHBSTW-00901]BBS35309.1 membrane protein [Enterobacter cloacae]
MMMTRVVSLFLLLTLAGCSAPQDAPVQRAQQGKIGPEHSLNMEQLCKDQAAHRYNSDVQNIEVTGFEHFQGSYELRGHTSRKEGFVCSFDADGQFLHLSMR